MINSNLAFDEFCFDTCRCTHIIENVIMELYVIVVLLLEVGKVLSLLIFVMLAVIRITMLHKKSANIMKCR
jgi:hypothetical protein